MEVAHAPAPPLNPWITVWRSPRRTIRAIVDSETRPSWMPVAVLAGASAVLQGLPVGAGFTTGTILFAAAVGLGQFVFAIVVGPFLLAFAGGWLGGNADPDDIRQAIVWGYVPVAATAVLWIPLLLLAGPSSPGDEGLGGEGAAALLALPILGAYIWSLVLQIAALAEVQQFSVLRAVLSMLLLAAPLLLMSALAG